MPPPTSPSGGTTTNSQPGVGGGWEREMGSSPGDYIFASGGASNCGSVWWWPSVRVRLKRADLLATDRARGRRTRRTKGHGKISKLTHYGYKSRRVETDCAEWCLCCVSALVGCMGGMRGCVATRVCPSMVGTRAPPPSVAGLHTSKAWRSSRINMILIKRAVTFMFTCVPLALTDGSWSPRR